MTDPQLPLFAAEAAAPRVATGRPSAAPFAAWAATAEAVRATRARREKGRLVATYLASLDDPGGAVAARWFAGAPFAEADARTLRIGRATLWPALAALAGVERERIAERRLALGSTAAVAGELLAGRRGAGLSLGDVHWAFEAIAAARHAAGREALVRALLAAASGAEAGVLVALLGGGLRIGLLAAQVEDAIAAAAAVALDAVRDAHALSGDLGEVFRRARAGTLAETVFAIGRPVGFMLAQPKPTPDAVAAALDAPFVLEAKYDGIRAQLHVQDNAVRLFSRTREDLTPAFPDLVRAGRALGAGLVLDGEVIAVRPDDPARIAPFRHLQPRLGRTAPAAALLREIPVAFVAFDALAVGGERIALAPWRERRSALEEHVPLDVAAPIRLAPFRWASDAATVIEAFTAARATGHEGLVAKDPDASYAAGRRGGRWLKLKAAAATLDVVVTAAERGNGRRAAVLSDLTFAVRASDTDDTLLDVGKAYTGLTDAELVALTATLESLVRERRGGWQRVEPAVVLEVTFDLVQASPRHASGYALRFPRIVRWRMDKPVSEIDTLSRVRALAGDGWM
ncbi:MAG: ATP-dependent DNA ligase [Gemmatimonadota bacterium]|jgi:DNA ligase-1|nr:ATP-dependent DNA ligase [Gemmatimonadota bacterium]